jgi:tryptophanyl-tRNA synthetase
MIKNRILSGVQPTGNLHLGNYLGAIKNFVKLQKDYECFFMLADLHSITVFQDPKQLRENVIETAAVFLACGLDPKKNVIFCQSGVPGHSELAWIFNCVARVGWLNRMTQFKEKAGSNKEKASVGLYTYPNLMAADILLYKATHVPVGEDQKQHIELCRDIAIKFNNDFNCKDFFVPPEPIIVKEVARIMSLKDAAKKMSKSDESDASRINLTDSEDEIVQKIKKAKTDNDLIPKSEKELENRPEARNLINIFSILKGNSLDKSLKELNGINFSELKNKLSEQLIKEIIPIGKKIKEFKQDVTLIKKILKEGSDRANIESKKTLKEVHKIVGLSVE